MNMKAAIEATKFMFLPTLTFLLVVFCWFFNWTAFVDFVTAQSGWAGFFRIVVLGVEICLWVYFYLMYKEQYEKDKAAQDIITTIAGEGNINHLQQIKNVDKWETERYLGIGTGDRLCSVFKTKHPEIFIIHSKIPNK